MNKVQAAILMKVAEEDDLQGLDPKQEIQAESLITRSLLDRLRKAFTSRGLEFFEFYIQLKRIELGEEPPTDLKQQYVKAANKLIQVTSPVDGRPLSPIVVNMIAESRTDLGLFLGRIASGRIDDGLTWMKLNNILVPIIEMAARDKGLYITGKQMGRRRWAIFRRMSPKQERAEKVKDVNPEAYDLIMRHGQTLADIGAAVKRRIERDGQLIAEDGFLAGRKVMYGVNPDTGEKLVYDWNGDIMTPKEFVAQRTAQNKANQTLSKAHNRSTLPVEDLRTFSDEEVDSLVGSVEMVAITDDKVKQNPMTRMFPVRRKPLHIESDDNPHITSVKVIISGRFKGCLLDDVINETGRMVEGTSYAYDPQVGQKRTLPKKIDTRNREPYVSIGMPDDIRTLPDGETVKTTTPRLYLRIPNTSAMTELRDAMKMLSCNSQSKYSKKGCIPSIEWVPLTDARAAGFFFDTKDYGIVMDTLKSLALSTEAMKQVKDYYKDLAYAEQATATENLGNYTAEAIGGFKTSRKDRNGNMKPVTLSTKQKQAVAWLDANGNKGVCGLDTGVGKTFASIAIMQKMIRDGLADHDATYTKPDGEVVQTNGRFLYVCPSGLKGNLTKEMRNFLSDASALIEKTDRVSYTEFNLGVKNGKIPRALAQAEFWQDRTWDPGLYVAIFFDEAQDMLSKSRNSPVTKAENALKVWHPHKICMTASPIDSDPMEAYILSAICNNKPLTGDAPDAQMNNKEMRKFRERFCETIGGRIIGVKQDPNTKRDLGVWVRRNVFFADKQDVDIEAGETALPKLRDATLTVTMDPGVEQVYRGVTRHFAAALNTMVKSFRDRDVGTGKMTDTTKEMESMMTSIRMSPVMKLMNDLSNCPDIALRDVATMIETGKYTNAKGVAGPIPHALVRIIAYMKTKFKPSDLRALSKRVGNPKLETAEGVIKKRLERSNGGSRSLLFSDDRKLCWLTAEHMASTVAGKHALALDNEIHIFNAGKPMTEVVFRMDEDAIRKLIPDPKEAKAYIVKNKGLARIPLPFKKLNYRRYMDLPASSDNVNYLAVDWQTFALHEIISADPAIKTLTLLGNVYKVGQNLQAFNTVVHLDRDTWNSESMKQRTARSWRQGQENAVTEITLDTVYADTDKEYDQTLDEIRKAFQNMSSDLFDSIIKGAQGFALGEEWESMTKEHASVMKLDRKMVELAASPYSGRSQVPGAA